MLKAYAYIDGWNFYRGINTPELHGLGFVDLKRLCQHLLGTRAVVTKVRYFSATGNRSGPTEKQQFWFDALEGAGVCVEELGFFGREHSEKTTDVRLALQLVEDTNSCNEDCDLVLLVSADADFIPALEKAKVRGKEIRIAFPPGTNCEELKRFHPFAERITKADLEIALFDAEGHTKSGVSLAKAHRYGWTCKVNGVVTPGDPKAEAEHWRRERVYRGRAR
jgi:uncharacterized LabA/DUF88 family protein